MENILEAMNKAALKLLSPLSVDDTYKTIVEEARELVKAEHGSILLGHGDSMVRVYSSDAFFEKIQVRKEGFVKSVYKDDKVIINDVNKVAKVHPIIKQMGIQSIVYVPLSYKSESIGVLTLHSQKQEHFSTKESNILRLYGSMASLAIKKSQLYSETKKALEIRDMFISMAAHELRTPLTSINGYIQLLHSRLSKREGVEGKWMQELYEESHRLTTLVKELLEVNRIRTGQLQFMWQECRIDDVLKKAIDEVTQSFPDRFYTFESAVDGKNSVIIGDEMKLVQVFSNIIDNAAKYSPRNSTVAISLADKKNDLVIKVTDQGKGIDKKDLPHIFAGQHQGGSGEEGMGIGLFFVENVIRQHRGSITVKSKVKKGTTFEVKLPKTKYE